MLEQTLRLCIHRAAIARRMFCPRCGSCLDCRRDVSIDIETPSGNSPPTAVLCASCYDSKGGEAWVRSVVERHNPENIAVIVDGRTFDRDAWAIADAMGAPW